MVAASPSFALALQGGALADILDRRRLILFTQAWQLLVAALLGVLTLAHAVNPALLLAATLLLGIGATLGMPAFTAVTPELVPSGQLPAAIGLNSMGVTASQAIGPAIGGLLVAAVGSGGVFLLNALSFLGVLAVVYLWRRPVAPTTLPPEHLTTAIRTGLRYVANAPELRAVLIRTAAFVLCYGAMPSLLAVVTRVRLHQSASMYGLLLAALGVGGVCGALVLPRVRGRFDPDAIALLFSLLYAACMLMIAQLTTFPLALPVLFVAGVAGMGVMSTLNIAAQSVLPSWIRGRGLAVFQLVFQAGYALSAAGWGVVATVAGLPTALTLAALALAAQTILSRRYRLTASQSVDVRSAHVSEAYTPITLAPDDGPILLTVEYSIPEDRQHALDAAIPDLRRARRRDGAMHWAWYADPTNPTRHVEAFLSPSWVEHQRLAQRLTGTDAAALQRIRSLHDGDDEPSMTALVNYRTGEKRSYL
ncbi:MFS transporter [Nocardia sp. NPDC020380]|uniref:MFS transporter n=1 Tax=Nocardia sp. NPDC020380 TaxID=3364309 RepID=UPI0037A4A78D